MRAQHGISGLTIAIFVVWMTAMVSCTNTVWADAQPDNSSAPTIESPDGKQLFCLAPNQNAAFPAVSLLERTDDDGDWVLLAGLSWNQSDGPGTNETILAGWTEDSGLITWSYTFEMLFIPRDDWSVRASMSFHSAEIHDAVTNLSQRIDPLRIGVAISYGNGGDNPVILDLGYGRMPQEGRGPAFQSDWNNPVQSKAGEAQTDPWIFSACLNIQF